MIEKNIAAEHLTPTRSLEGEIIGERYELTRLIGSGGMGQVYRARQLSTGGRVALKIMEVNKRKASSLDRFRHEAETTARLTHPNTVRILDFGADGELLFLVMEYLSGSELTQFIRPNGQSNAFVAHLLLQVACSLSEAHSRGVVHRDIKPNNIMLLHHAGLPSFVKVIDFGIARAISGPGHGTVGILGTVGYIAPEHAKERILPNARSDLYALGCVAYEVLTGQLPFEGISHRSAPLDILEAHMDGIPRPLRSIKPDADPELADLVMSLIQRRPDRRPESAGEILVPLQGIRARLMPGLGQGYQQISSAKAASVSKPASPAQDTMVENTPDRQPVIDQHALSFAAEQSSRVQGIRAEPAALIQHTEPEKSMPHPDAGKPISFLTDEQTEISGPAQLVKTPKNEQKGDKQSAREDAETFKLKALDEDPHKPSTLRLALFIAAAFGLGLCAATWLSW